jgi:CPA2 family monovalent cation:H+ antiporter-2
MISEMVTIMLSSPFIWGMLFSYKVAIIPEYTKKTLNPIVFLVWLATLIELVFLSVIYFHTWFTTTILLVIVTAFFATAYKQIEKSYYWFESQLVKNIKKQPVNQPRYSALSPWDTHLVEIVIGDRSPIVNQPLKQSQIREIYGVNIVAIHRGHQTLIAPRGLEVIHDNDKLFVIGSDDQIESFKNIATMTSAHHEKTDHLSDFALKPVLITDQHPLAGKSIRDSLIREKLNALVVGIERGNAHIVNPNPEMLIKLDDILLLAGEDIRLQQLEEIIAIS